MDINLLSYVLAGCDVYLKLEGVTFEKSNRATLSYPVVNSLNWNSASGVRDSFVCYLEVCYKPAAKFKSVIDDYAKVR